MSTVDRAKTPPKQTVVQTVKGRQKSPPCHCATGQQSVYQIREGCGIRPTARIPVLWWEAPAALTPTFFVAGHSRDSPDPQVATVIRVHRVPLPSVNGMI